MEKHIKLFINLSPTFTTCLPSIAIRRLNLDKETGQNYEEQNEIEMEGFFCESIFLCYIQKFRFEMVLYAFSKLRAQYRMWAAFTFILWWLYRTYLWNNIWENINRLCTLIDKVKRLNFKLT